MLDAERALRTYVSALKHLEDHERRVRNEGKAKKSRKPKSLNRTEALTANYCPSSNALW